MNLSLLTLETTFSTPDLSAYMLRMMLSSSKLVRATKPSASEMPLWASTVVSAPSAQMMSAMCSFSASSWQRSRSFSMMVTETPVLSSSWVRCSAIRLPPRRMTFFTGFW